MPLEQLIADYGYAALAVGTFFEGETILVLGGVAAHRGYLSLPGVMAAAFIGSLAGDQLYYFIGRRHGTAFLERRPAWKERSARVLSLLERHQTWLILVFRFLYGLRTVTPFLIGASGVKPARFVWLNALGAAAWAAGIGALGYVFGEAIELLIGDVKRYEAWVFGGLALAGLAAWIVRELRKPRPATRGPQAGPPP